MKSNVSLFLHILLVGCTAWCSEIGSPKSLDACNSGAFSDVREPISLHQAVYITVKSYAEEHQPRIPLGNKNIFTLRFCRNKNIDFDSGKNIESLVFTVPEREGNHFKRSLTLFFSL